MLFDEGAVADPALNRHVVMGMDEGVAIDGKSLPCSGLMHAPITKPSTDVTNSNDAPGMPHLFHVHGTTLSLVAEWVCRIQMNMVSKIQLA